MRDVADLAQVSLQTVSNYVHGRFDEMGQETRERVASAMETLGYRTNIAAASLRSQRVRTIAFLVLDEHSEFLADPLTDLLIAGVGDVARDEQYAVLIQGARPGKHDPEFFRSVREGRADGAVIQLSGPRALRREYIEEARSLGVGIVVIDEVDLPPDVMGVRAQQQRGARELTEHLIDRGHRRLAFIGARVPWAVVEQRVAGFRAAIRARGLPVDEMPVLLDAGFQAQGGEELVARLLEWDDPPTAVVCGSDLLAAGAMKGAKALGRRIPDDVAIAGFDDFQFSQYLDPPLTTVRVPAYEMGRAAAAVLIAALEGRDADMADTLFPTSLVLRGSA